MERSEFERSQSYLAQLLGWLENLAGSLTRGSIAPEGSGGPSPAAQGPDTPLPDLIARILSDSGYLEGLHLKSLGLLSQELQDFIAGIGFAFEVEVHLPSGFKLPFTDQEAALQRKTLNPFREKAWLAYHGALLSAYAMRPLRFQRISSSTDGLEETLRVREAEPSDLHAPAPSALAPGPLHALNNALAGITSYVSLILTDRKDDAELQGKLGLVLEAAYKAAAAAKGN
jgi:hypothetical protein